jgi:hypothetical protein
MGTIAIGVLDIGALLIGGIIGRHVQPNVTKCCSAEEKEAVLAKISEVEGLLAKLKEVL